MIVVEENVLELLKRKEEDQQEAIDSYNNYESPTSSSSSTSVSSSSRKKSRIDEVTPTQLRQNEEDNIRSGDLTEDDHGQRFISDDDEFFEAAAQEKKMKAAAMMEAQREILNEEEAYDEYTCYDGSTATMESCDEEFEKIMSDPEPEDEGTYEEDFTNYTYERVVWY
jgi:hypothetical protein